MAGKVKRSEVATFLNITPLAAATYHIVGEGVKTGKINMNPQVVEETYIHEDTGNTFVESYKPTFPIEATAIKGDEVFDYVDGLRKARAVLAAAETDIVNVWLYETPAGDVYPAEKQPVSIQVDDFGGDGGASTQMNYTINYLGDPVLGTFDLSLATFTPTP